MKRAWRDTKIRQGFNGRNHADLARSYGLTVTQIYDIIAWIRIEKPAV
ncbi:MAG TPA: transcriptional regulator [Gammaproteobacteria bacterium]|nr:transcriptional regulator [Gammaproteobacteria bacterium]